MANIPFIPLDKPTDKPLAGEFLPLDRPFNPYTGKAIPTPEEAEKGLKEAFNYFRQNIFSPDVPEEWKPQPDEKFPEYAKRVGKWEKSIMSEEFPWAVGEVAGWLKSGGIPRKVIRIEEKGIKTSFSKPQGLYTSPADVKSPHLDLGGTKTTYATNPSAKILSVDASHLVRTNRGLVGQSAGIATARKILGNKKYEELINLSKKDLADYLKFHWNDLNPNKVNWVKYYDQQEMLEGYAGLLAKKQGYDAIWAVDKTSPEFSEYVGLTKKAFKKGGGLPPKPPVPPDAAKELPKYAGSINLQRQAISDAAKKAELEYFERFGVKTKITHEETIHEANKIIDKFRKDPAFYERRVQAIKGGKTPSIPEVTAHRIVNANDQKQLQEMAQAVDKGDLPVEEFNLFRAQVGNRQLQVVDPMASDAGRRLNSFNIMVGQERAFKALGELNKLNKRQRKLLANLDFDDPVAVERFVKDLPNPKFKDYFYEYWYNSILSGIPTHVVNVASNTAWRMFQVPHRGLTGAIDLTISKLRGRQQEVFMREMLPLMSGAIKGKPKAARRAWDVVRHGRIQEAESKWAAEMGSTLGAWDRAPNAVMRGVGKVITVPTKALRGMDVYANTLSYDAHMGALAKRSWLQGTRKVGKSNKFTTFKDYQKSFHEAPPKWAHEEAMKHAKYSTFMDDPGPVSEWIIQGREKVPGLRLVIPFVNTIGNLVKRGAEMTPLVGMAMYKGRKPAEVIAKQLEGGIVAYLAYSMAEQGKIVGDIPKGKNERLAFYRDGKKPWSVKIGDNYIQYRRVEPFNMPLAATAMFSDRIKEAHRKHGEGEEFEKVATKAFGNLAQDWTSYMLESSYLSGVSDWMSKHGDKSKIPTRLGASLVPFSGFWRSINRSIEAYEEGTAKVYEHRDMLNSFAQVIPGLYKLRKPRLNVWGKPVELEGGVFRHWLPYKWSKATEDPVEHFLQKIEVYPGLPNRTVKIDGKNVALDEDIYQQYAVDTGTKLKSWLDEKIGNEVWQQRLKSERGIEKLKSRIRSKTDKIRERSRKQAIKVQKSRSK